MNRTPPRTPVRFDLLAIFLLTAIVPAIFAPLLSHAIRGTSTTVPQSDFPPHSVLAAELRAQRRFMIPHPLYHLALLGVQRGVEMFRGNHPSAAVNIAIATSQGEVGDDVLAKVNDQYGTAAIITNVFFVWLLSLILWFQIRTAAAIRSTGGIIAGVALVVALMILTPAAFLHAQDGRFYFGYIGINVWHNPTVIAAKPFALLTFIAILAAFPDHTALDTNPPPRRIFLLAFIVILGAMVKPSFLMCLLPAVLILAICRQTVSNKNVKWYYLLFGLILPTVITLAWQSWIYSRYTGGAHAVFSPLTTMSAMSRHLTPKLILSIFFPLACYLAWWTHARSRTRLNLAWLTFLFGLLFTYLVAETRRTRHGNFLWGAQLSLFVLFVESVTFMLGRMRSESNGAFKWFNASDRAKVCAAILIVHAGFGAAYCVHLVSSKGATSWLTAGWWYH